MMTRKDYELIASHLAGTYRAHYMLRSLDGVNAAIYSVARALAKDNPRFDRDKFIEACKQRT